MKRKLVVVATALIASSMLSGCYGKFALTRKLYQTNGEVRDKFARSLVTVGFMFIAPFTGMADWILFNTIEFWSGSNPIAEGEKDFRYAKGDDSYDVHAVKNGDTVRYDIAHTRSGLLVDTSVVTWNLTTGAATTDVSNAGGTTRYDGLLGVENPQSLMLSETFLASVKVASL